MLGLLPVHSPRDVSKPRIENEFVRALLKEVL